eukprot:CAMPEP_0179122638 /NCGR_PEP_ID=MMETSP0796-20121207/57887_1 /TAXON_ID=73915 /ORGANISM="Pyrodinium bahamense, Strain pbaha01" /LENGTH=215 /DNA_ID=CAMNT_0020821263 /DNA_START=98 /DNA_END=745 /DNA_ORIENTATION=+
MFCCGCSLGFGVTLILMFHLLQNLFYISTAFSNIILKIPTFGVNAGLVVQTFNGAWCMLGLPFIIVGFWGVLCRLESHLRLYFGYFLISVLLDILYFGSHMFKDVCDDMPTFLKKHGSAFACGFTRIFALLLVILVFVVEGYCIFIVWSLCEDLRVGGSGTALPELLRGREAHKRREAHVSLGDTLYGAPVAPGYPRAYGSLTAPGLLPSGSRIG